MKRILWALALLALAGDLAAAGIRNGCIPGTNGCGNCGTINDPDLCPPPGGPLDTPTADFDRDGYNDLLFHHYSAGLKAWARYAGKNPGWMTFSPAGMGNSDWSAVAVGYFGGPLTGFPARDQDSDIVWQHNNGALKLWLMNQNQRLYNLDLACPTPPPAGGCTNPVPPWKVVASGHFGSVPGSTKPFDGKSDILFWNETTGALRVWIMNSTASTATVAKEISLSASMPPGSWKVAGTGFFDSSITDFWSDILWSNSATGELQVWLMNATSVAQQILVGFESNLDWNSKGVVDCDQDAFPDPFFRKEGTGKMRAWRMKGCDDDTGECVFLEVPATLSVPDTMTPWKPVAK